MLQPGLYQVEYRHESAPFRAGLLIAGIGLLVMACAGLYALARDRRAAKITSG